MSPDTLATIGLLAAASLLALFVRFTAPGGLFRIPLIMRGVRYHRAGRGRHVHRTGLLVLPAAAEPVPATVPWAAPEVPATIPDALTNVRTPA